MSEDLASTLLVLVCCCCCSGTDRAGRKHHQPFLVSVLCDVLQIKRINRPPLLPYTMASAVMGIIGFRNMMLILKWYRFFKNLAKKIVFTILRGLWFSLKWLVCVGLPYPARFTFKYCVVPSYEYCCTPGSLIYYCKETCCGCCSSCKVYYKPYEALEAQSN